MSAGRAVSRTAGLVALYRAIESSRPRGMRLFEDPPAPAFLARRFRWALDRARYLAPLGRGREPLAEVQRAALVEARGVA